MIDNWGQRLWKTLAGTNKRTAKRRPSVRPFLEALEDRLLLATHLVLDSAAGATAGVAFIVTCIAEDQSNNTVTSYSGVVQFTSTDTQATFTPATATLSSGTGLFTATLKT